MHRQPTYNISTGGDNSNLCSNGSSTAASAGISAFWYLVVLSASLVEHLGQVSIEEEIKKRTQTVFVPGWFTVDLKIGVSSDILIM